jgi:GYF domain 2
MSIYLYKNNQQYGPYDEAAVLEWLRTGRCSLGDLAYREGMTQWQPLKVLFPTVAPPQMSSPSTPPAYNAPTDNSGNKALAMALLQEVAGRMDSEIGNSIARPFVSGGYNPHIDSFCKEMIAQCDRAENTAPDDRDVLRASLMLKAQLYGNWQKMQGTRGTEKAAIECYERALPLVISPEMEADLRYRYGVLCSIAAVGVGGGKDKAIANFQRAIALVGANSELGRACANEIARLNISSGGCLGGVALISFVVLFCIPFLLSKI